MVNNYLSKAYLYNNVFILCQSFAWYTHTMLWLHCRNPVIATMFTMTMGSHFVLFISILLGYMAHVTAVSSPSPLTTTLDQGEADNGSKALQYMSSHVWVGLLLKFMYLSTIWNYRMLISWNVMQCFYLNLSVSYLDCKVCDHMYTLSAFAPSLIYHLKLYNFQIWICILLSFWLAHFLKCYFDINFRYLSS